MEAFLESVLKTDHSFGVLATSDDAHTPLSAAQAANKTLVHALEALKLSALAWQRLGVGSNADHICGVFASCLTAQTHLLLAASAAI